MALIQRELRMQVAHHEIGDYIEYGWFRGVVVSLNANALQQLVRVEEVIRPAIGRIVGTVQRVPFNLGREYARPSERNSEERSSCAATSESEPQSGIGRNAQSCPR